MGRFGGRDLVGKRHHLNHGFIGGMPDAGNHGQRKNRHGFSQRIAVVSIQPHITATAADDGHHIKRFLPVFYFPELLPDGTHGSFALKQGGEKMNGKFITPTVLADHVHKVAEPFTCLHRNHGNSFGQ